MPHVPPSVNSAAFAPDHVIDAIVNVLPPVFVTVAVFAELARPRAMLPKSMLVGVNVARAGATLVVPAACETRNV